MLSPLEGAIRAIRRTGAVRSPEAEECRHDRTSPDPGPRRDARAEPSHSLQRLGADEIRLAKALLTEHGLVGERTRFAYLGLEEPPKDEVLAFRPGQAVERRVRAILLDLDTGAARDVVASLTRRAIDSKVQLDTVTDSAAITPMSAGSFGLPGEEGRRMLRVLSFVQDHEKGHPWAHPVDGLVAYVDLIERRVLHLIDQELLPVPQEPGNFEAAAVFSEEARVPRRTVPVAIYASLALIGATYALASWAMSVHYGDDQVAAVAGEQGPGMLFAMSSSTVAEIATVLFMTSLFAAMLSFHNAVARYMFALGRERVLPAALGRTHARTGAPRIASLAQSAVGLAVIVVYALAGWDPAIRLFFWLGTSGAFGVLCLLAVTSIAVIRFFTRDPRDENAWRRLLAPALATIALLAMVWFGLANYATLLGVPPGSTEAWALPAAFAVAAVVGIAYGRWLRSARPNVYHHIGLGPEEPRRGS